VALVGNPNCGKTALFNLLTGARQKVANYAGVTVERKIGTARLKNGRTVSVVDLPGAYSLTPATPDEQITLEVIEGRRHGEAAPDAIVAVVDATNLRMNLRLVLELKRLGRPLMVALNMADVARDEGLHIDVARLAAELGCPVVETVAVRSDGHAGLLALLDAHLGQTQASPVFVNSQMDAPSSADLQKEVRRIIAIAAPGAITLQRFQHRIDAVVMHPVWGLALLAVVLFLMFQAVFSWANVPMDAIKAGMAGLGDWTTAHMAEGPLRSLLVDGVIAGAGSVLVFLPQILILFFFILLLEDSGYLPRAAFLLDNLMGKVGLSGRAFIPLLSSFACAIPGIMATRTIESPKDRLVTILVAPLMSCSARLPVYTLLIGACITGGVLMQSLTMLSMYLLGIVVALGMAWLFKKTLLKGETPMLVMELPPYRRPVLKIVLRHMWDRSKLFLQRAGTVILGINILLWFLTSYPKHPELARHFQEQRATMIKSFSRTPWTQDQTNSLAQLDADEAAANVQHSFAGYAGRMLEPAIAPLGFDWKMGIGIMSSFAAREVFVSTMSIVYSQARPSGADEKALNQKLQTVLQEQKFPNGARVYTPLRAVTLMVFYVLALQCVSTVAVVRRETNSWKWPIFQWLYMGALAWLLAFITYQGGRWLGFG
jgi:ferrous iron transport protein B